MMNVNRRQATLACLGLLATRAGTALAQGDTDYPARPVTLIVPFAAGGGTDATLRIVARHFQDITGQSMTVENRPGGGTLVALSHLKSQKPDGYTLGVMTRAQHVTYWRESGKVPVHPLEDFTYISGTHGSIFGLVVKADSPFNTLQDVARYAKANPGKLSFGNIGVGTTHNLVALEFARQAGIDVVHVSFKGEAESNTAALGGHVDVSASSGVFIPQVLGGKMKVLGLALEQRLPAYPDWKTMREQGYDVLMDTSVGIGGPQGMSDVVVAKLDAVFRKMTADPQFEAALMKLFQPVQYVPTAQYRKAQQAQFLKERALIAQYQLGAR
jgi:tripartite-type tricarboxylate transporter receptor subunit TctC